MSQSALDRYAEHFERLLGMDKAQRASALANMELDPASRTTLERMLANDASDEDPLADAIARSVDRLAQPRDDRLGQWRLAREIGSGGMGTVFLAERVEGNFTQQAAIKLLRGFPTEEGKRRLRRERQILAELDHPHIARLLDGGESADGQPWLAIEYVDGQPLLDFIAFRAPPLKVRLELFLSMLEAVEHAHQRLIIHRDIKPANVLVTRDGVVKLVDFGIARLLELDPERQGDSSTQVFSRGYASPEQRAGGAITTASDVYSLGILLEEILSGRRADASISERVPALVVDSELAGIIAKASADVPAARYSGIADLRDDVLRYVQGRPVRAAAMTRRYRLRKFIGRHRFGTAMLIIAVLLSSGFVWRLAYERQRALTAEAQALSAAQRAERDARRAQSSLAFLKDAFAAAAPENSLSKQVSVRELLESARVKLDERSVADQELRQSMQRMLGELYGKLGEANIGSQLLASGLDGVQPRDASEARALAAELDQYGNLLGIQGRVAEALDAANQGSTWREQFAPEDAVERIHSLHSLAVANHRNGDNRSALAMLREAEKKIAANDISQVDLIVNGAAIQSSLLAIERECQPAVDAADRGLLALQAASTNSPERIPLLRAKASALSACGFYVDAEKVLREAIALQETVVSSSGSLMMVLTNDLALILNDLGRYAEAAAMLQRSDSIMSETGLGGIDQIYSWTNFAGVLENAGDYAGALTLNARAMNELDELHIPADHILRRSVERSGARTNSLAGHHDEARATLLRLRARSEELDGKESGEYAMLTWQLAGVANRMRRPDIGIPLVDESEQLWRKLVPATHPIFAHILRGRSRFAASQNDFVAARRYQMEAVAALESEESSAVDLAIARSELANLRWAAKRPAEARSLLQMALPILRGSLLKTERSRIEAEQLASKLSM